MPAHNNRDYVWCRINVWYPYYAEAFKLYILFLRLKTQSIWYYFCCSWIVISHRWCVSLVKETICWTVVNKKYAIR